MKIHVLPNPRTPSGLKNPMDPFSVFAYKYIKYLSPKYDMVHYGLPGSEVNCEHVEIATDPNDIEGFNKLSGQEIQKRKTAGDIIVCFYGTDNKLACDMNSDCTIIEPSIGYRANGVFAPYRVFTSYAQMHMFYGERGMLMNPSWYDEVIPNGFTVSDFEFKYKEHKKDYFLYFGRVCEEKGINLCIQATEKLGKKLIIAGPGSLQPLGYDRTPDHVEMLGLVGAEERKKLMMYAKAILGPTHYVEPFGNMVIEANLCGTPAITTDWGGFTETIEHGKTGFRFRDFEGMLLAMKMIDKIDPIDCLANGLKYSDELIHIRHDKYLQRVIKNSFYE